MLGRPRVAENTSALRTAQDTKEGNFRVPNQKPGATNDHANAASQNEASAGRAARGSAANGGEIYAAETNAKTGKASSGPKRHWLDYATAFLTLAAAGGAITAAVFT